MATGTIVEQRKAICVQFEDTNNNKFWEMIIYDDGTALTRWGRVGGHVTEKPTTESQARRKWAEKTRASNRPDKLYTEVKALDTGGTSSRSSVNSAELANVARSQIKHSNPLVQKLIDYLVRVNAHQIMKQSGGKIQYDASSATFKTPLGVIDPVQVAEARDLLAEIADLVREDDYANRQFNSLLNSYLRLIPHDVGMTKISPKLIFPDFQAVTQENDLLDGLDASFTQITTQPKKKTKKKKDAPQVFNVELTLVEDDGVVKWVDKLYRKTLRTNHVSSNLALKAVYEVKIASMAAAFEAYGAKLKDVRKLWHGTKASNLLSILRQGLIIPPSSSSHCTGRMYGNGVYASSVSTKALNYATNFWGSGGDTSRTFMFLVDMAMGRYYEAKDWGGGYPRKGYDSTWAKAGRALRNDEMIVYRLDQCNLTHLVEFGPKSRYR